MMDIKFTFSVPYQSSLNKRGVDFPAHEIEALSDFWKKDGQLIEDTLKKITNLSFVEKSIKCYLNTEFSISDPLSIKIEDLDEMRDSLIHELIHQLIVQNDFDSTNQWKMLNEEYAEEVPATRVHLAVHRINYLLAQELYPHRLERIMTFSEWPAYVRSWEILKNPEKVDSILGLSTNLES